MRVKNVASPDVIKADFARLAREYPNLAAETLVDVVDRDIGPETLQEVPVETGDLSRSWTGARNGVKIEDGRLYIDIGYGMNYALYVHEIPPGDLKLPGGGAAADIGRTAYHRPPTKWKYLGDPVNRNIGRVPQRLLDKVDKTMGGG